MRHILEGIALVFRERKLWPFIWKPMLLAAAVYIAIVVVGAAAIVPVFESVLGRFGMDPPDASREQSIMAGIAYVFYGLMLWFFSGILFLAISSIFSSFIWEKLSSEVDEHFGFPSEIAKHRLGTLALDSAVRLAISMFVMIGSLLTGWACLGIIGVIWAGWLGLHDYTCASYMRAGKPLWVQIRDVYRLNGWLSFQLVSGLLTLVPFLNVLLLPGLVAGGTLMYSRSQDANPS